MLQRSRLIQLLAAPLLFIFAALAFADVVTMKDKTPILTIDVPDTFTSSETTRGIEVKTRDGEVYLGSKGNAPGEFDAIVAEYMPYLAKGGDMIPRSRI